MRQLRWLPLAAVVGLFGSSLAAAQEVKPAVILRVKPIDEIVKDAGAMNGGLMPADQIAAMVDQAAAATFGEKWRDAVDPTKPIGFYAEIAEDIVSSKAILMVPVKEPKAFLDVLKRAGIEVEKDGDIYSFTPPAIAPVPLPPMMVRITGGYAYATMNGEGVLDKDKLLPAASLKGKETSLIDLSLNVQRIPEALRTLAAAQIEQYLKNALDNGGQLSPGVKLDAASVKTLIEGMNSFLEDGNVLSFGLDVDRSKGEAGFDFALSGKSGSKLATLLAKAVTPVVSETAALAGTESVARLVYSLRNTNADDPAAAEAMEKSLSDQLEKVPDEEMRKLVGGLVKPLSKALQIKNFDATVALKGPSSTGRYTLVAGMKLNEPAELEKAIIATVAKMPEEQQAMFKLAPAGGIHKLLVSAGAPDEVKTLFGDGEVNLVFRDGAVILAYGAEGLAAAKTELGGGKKLPAMVFDVTPAKVLPLLKIAAERSNDENLAKALPALEKALGKMTESVRLFNVQMDGTDNGMSVHYAFNVDAVAKLIAAVQQARAGE